MLPPMSHRVPSMCGHSMDGMDKMCGGHPKCAAKTKNIPNDFGLSFRPYICTCHLQCHNDYCDHMHHNGDVYNNTEWAELTPLSFSVNNIVPTRSTIKCKVCRSTLVCIALWRARIIYIRSTTIGMFVTYITLVYLIIYGQRYMSQIIEYGISVRCK